MAESFEIGAEFLIGLLVHSANLALSFFSLRSIVDFGTLIKCRIIRSNSDISAFASSVRSSFVFCWIAGESDFATSPLYRSNDHAGNRYAFETRSVRANLCGWVRADQFLGGAAVR
jgi:hypothetical protein